MGWVLWLVCLRCRARAASGTRAARPVPARSAHVRAARARARPAPPHRQLTRVRSFVSFLWLLWFLGSGALGTRAARPCSLARARAQRTRARCAHTLTHRRAPRRQLTHSPSFRLVARLGPEGGCWVGLRSGQRVGAGADVGTLCCTAVCPRARPSVRLLVCLSVRPSVCPSVRLSVCPSVRLSVCPVAERDLAGSAGGIRWMGSLAQWLAESEILRYRYPPPMDPARARESTEARPGAVCRVVLLGFSDAVPCDTARPALPGRHVWMVVSHLGAPALGHQYACRACADANVCAWLLACM